MGFLEWNFGKLFNHFHSPDETIPEFAANLFWFGFVCLFLTNPYQLIVIKTLYKWCREEHINNWEHITSSNINSAVVTVPMHILFAIVGKISEILVRSNYNKKAVTSEGYRKFSFCAHHGVFWAEVICVWYCPANMHTACRCSSLDTAVEFNSLKSETLCGQWRIIIHGTISFLWKGMIYLCEVWWGWNMWLFHHSFSWWKAGFGLFYFTSRVPVPPCSGSCPCLWADPSPAEASRSPWWEQPIQHLKLWSWKENT